VSTVIQSVSLKIPANSTSTLTFPDGVLKPAMWSGTSGDELTATKMELFSKRGTNLGFAIGATPTAREEVIFVASTAGSINKFAALLNDTGTSTSIDFILKKNGASIMSSNITITHGTSDGVVVEGTLSSTTFVAGDRFSVSMTVSSSTGAQGPFAWAEFIETLS